MCYYKLSAKQRHLVLFWATGSYDPPPGTLPTGSMPLPVIHGRLPGMPPLVGIMPEYRVYKLLRELSRQIFTRLLKCTDLFATALHISYVINKDERCNPVYSLSSINRMLDYQSTTDYKAKYLTAKLHIPRPRPLHTKLHHLA